MVTLGVVRVVLVLWVVMVVVHGCYVRGDGAGRCACGAGCCTR